MDSDLADYDQVDEAMYFLTNKLGLDSQPSNGGHLLVTLSSSTEQPNNEETNCENDFVFLPAPNNSNQTNSVRQQPTASISNQIRPDQGNSKFEQSCSSGNRLVKNSIACDRLQNLSHTTAQVSLSDARHHQVAELAIDATKTGPSAATQLQQPTRASHPLMTINSNGKNPFSSLQQMSPDKASNQTYQPFWMRPESYASKPIGLLEVSTNNTCTPGQISDLMHQIVTKSDSIYIAIPCAYCHEPIACPPSDISSWLNHMNRAHNCKVCPICNKLIGLGPMRDLDIMKKHVVAHIDDDWLEKRNAKANFTFGLQQHWFSGGRCSVKETRSMGIFRT